MFRKRVICSIIVSIFAVFCFFIKLNAQTEMTSEKKTLLKELFEVTDVKKMIENTRNIMSAQMDKNYIQMMSALLKKEGIPAAKQEEIKNKFVESQTRFSERFKKLFAERIDLDQVIEQLYYPLYDKYFTENELRDLVIFYKSQTGQKSLRIMPQLFQESMQKTSELLNPRIAEIINEIIQEEKNRLLELVKTSQENKG